MAMCLRNKKKLTNHKEDLSGQVLQNTEKTGIDKTRTYTCKICKRKFSWKCAYRRHCTKRINCDFCGKICCNIIILKQHRKSHDEERTHVCPICGVKLTGQSQFKAHKKTHLKFTCVTCDKQFLIRSSSTGNGDTSTGNKPYRCGKCRRKLLDYVCDICGGKFKSKCSLKNHQKVHTGEKPYKCDICSHRFPAKSTMLVHRRSHTGEKPYKCHMCEKRFVKKGTLKEHVMSHTGEFPYKCDTCGLTFKRKNNLNSHLRVHTGEKQCLCDICGRMFSDTTRLNYHLRCHTGKKPYKCNTCGKYFANKKYVKVHMLIHTGEKPHHCDVCDKYFRHLSDLREHAKRHVGENPFQCETCGKNLASTRNLKLHQRIHTEKKNKKKLPVNEDIQEESTNDDNINVRTTFKNFRCRVCGMQFLRKSTLKLHDRTHVKKKTFKCLSCGKIFLLKNTLKLHKKKHANEKSSKLKQSMTKTTHAVKKNKPAEKCQLVGNQESISCTSEIRDLHSTPAATVPSSNVDQSIDSEEQNEASVIVNQPEKNLESHATSSNVRRAIESQAIDCDNDEYIKVDSGDEEPAYSADTDTSTAAHTLRQKTTKRTGVCAVCIARSAQFVKSTAGISDDESDSDGDDRFQIDHITKRGLRLKMVQVFFRHGARTPLNLIPNPKNIPELE
uniref:Zinc finger protein 224-like n=1 Tax=Saccoglossus kowalevskii TaxID=10224 RepID=A0ABM0ML25_SACKO